MTTSKLYHYRADVLSITDGDTLRVRFHLGLGFTWAGEDGKGAKVRLIYVNTPETEGATRTAGIEARDAVQRLIGGQQVIIHTELDRLDRHNRILGYLWADVGAGPFLLNEYLVTNGFAELNTYGRPFPGWPEPWWPRERP